MRCPFDLLSLTFISAAATSSITCDLPISLSQSSYEIPSWFSSNFSCLGSPQAYVVRLSPGKGLGVFATQTLEPGDVIMQEVPAIKIRPPEFRDGVGYPLDAIGRLAREAFETLSQEMQAEVLSLHAYTTTKERNSSKIDELMAIFRSNAYNTGQEIGLFPKIARINHSCRPNTSYFWNERLNKRIVYATRRIEEGEEFSVSYIPLLHSHDDRQKRLNQYGFKCTCEACAARTDELRTSDSRRKNIRETFIDLEPKLTLDPPESSMAKKNARKMAKDSAKLTKLVEEEGLADYYAQAYRLAAIAHARIEEWEPATLWAHKSYQLRLMADPHADGTKEMQILTSRFIASWNEQVKNKSKGKH